MNRIGAKTVFVAGAAGVIGRRLCPLLVADGWRVVGSTRSPERGELLRKLGVAPVIVDVYDAPSLCALLAESQPAVVVHQLTDLPADLDPKRMPEALLRNARIREVGTRNLIAAAVAAGSTRLVAQSIAFAYAQGAKPHREDAALDLDNPAMGATARGAASLERQVLSAPLEGIVLRYGRLYGPGTGVRRPRPGGAVHVDAAADAARRAAARGGGGVYNIAEEDGTVASRKARRHLGWRSEFRL